MVEQTWSLPTMEDYSATGNFFSDKEEGGLPNNSLVTGPSYQGAEAASYLRSRHRAVEFIQWRKDWSSVKAVSR